MLNVLDGNSCVLPLASGNNSPVELIAGEAPQEFTWSFSFTSGFSPLLDEDYPVTVVLNPGQGDVDPGIYLSPRYLALTFTDAVQGQTPLQAQGTIGAYFYANAPSSGSFKIPQDAFVANSLDAGLCDTFGADIPYVVSPSPIPPLPEPG